MSLTDGRPTSLWTRPGPSVVGTVVLAMVVAGSATAGTAAYFTLSHAASTSCATSPSPGNLSIQDDLGRCTLVPFAPHRVAVLSPSILDIIYRLGLRADVVGVDCYAAADGGLSDDYSPDQVTLWNLSASMCVQIGPTFAPETLANLTPDLVLASTIDPLPAIETVTTEAHTPLLVLQPSTLLGILSDVTLVAEIFGVSSGARALNSALSAELTAAALARGTGSWPTALLTYYADQNGYWTYGPGTFGDSLLAATGATSVSGAATVPYPELAPSQILTADPTWIVYGVGFGLDLSTYAAGPHWSDFNAVKTNHTAAINSNWLTEPDPSMILSGIPALLALFHPAA